MKKAIVFVINSAFGLIVIFVNLAFLARLFITYTRLQENIIFSAVFLTWIIAAIRSRKRRAADLKGKGLTLDDVDNIKFVKQWDETRKKGLRLYCITDGGIILGAYLWLGISILLIATSIVKFQSLVDDPANMFAFIGYAYLAGAVIGIIINRIKWPYNESRFMKLTDPLNERFQQMLTEKQ